MISETTAPTIQECRWCGAGAPADASFCPQCTKILPLPRRRDYFTFLGVPRRLNIDPADLEQRFRDRSRQFHPDYFYNAPLAERRASLERSSYLNDAYRTLKQPIARIAYLLELEGALTPADKAAGAGATKVVPPGLLEEVFALNEELDEVRDLRSGGASKDEWTARLQRARQPIEDKRAEHERRIAEVSRQWDALLGRPAGDAERAGVLQALGELMLERNYITNLLAGIERELSQ
ncbi:MAG: Fe-S protein assembly co-chaperone HscB [Luteitalea sp.]|nr:Fe-S protein assembly co-chaperone HscB [Luteitalea sp.]